MSCPLADRLLRLSLGLTLLTLCLSSALAQELFVLPDSPSSAPAQDSERAQLYPLLSQYRGEEERGVLYLRGRQRALHLVRVRDGLLVDARGALLNAGVPLPAQRVERAPAPPPTPSQARASGYAIYAIDASGQLYVSFEAEKDRVHHSSLLAGEPALCAGELIIFHGRLLLINNQSGHYRPPPKALQRAIKVLSEAGLDMSEVTVKPFGG